MNADERRFLFQQMIAANIRQYENGLTELPLAEVRNYCNAIGLNPDENYVLYFSLPGGEKEYYNFSVGAGTDYMALLELIEVYYWDSEDNTLEVISGGKTLYGALYRDFYSGEDLVCGYMSVDRFGRVFIETMHGDNIVAIFRISLTANDTGIQLFKTDGEGVFRIWSDGNTLFITPTILMLVDSSSL